ncbi:MAG: hypothetical protein IJK64_10115 [Clostridia bacterium]|nr:hypothetical protein [Clostridia bacterium]
MYESITSFLPKLDADAYGKWHIDESGDGTLAHPFRLPFVEYSRTVSDLQQAVFRFVADHEELGLYNYNAILASANLKSGYETMKQADVSALDGTTVMALLVGAVRAERFCDGTFLSLCEDGCIARWLSRLAEIEKEE